MQPNEPKRRAERLVGALTDVLGIPLARVARAAGVSTVTAWRWRQGRNDATPAAADRLAAFLARETTAPEGGTHVPDGRRVRAVVARLHAAYGSPHLNNKSDPLDELFFILLSLKTSHRSYEAMYERFHAHFHPWSTLLDASPQEVETYIRSGGLGSLRARTFVQIAERLQADFGTVDLEALRDLTDAEVEGYLTSLPGVGLKTARCVAMYALGRAVLPVDTHTYRVGVRVGLVPTSRSITAAHAHFDAAVPADLAYALHTNFVAHGREICVDPIPKCGACVVRDLCDYGRRTAADAIVEGDREAAASAATAAAAPAVMAPTPRHGAGGSRSTEGRARPAVADLPAEDRTITAVDIYAGCGGLSAGLRAAGIRVPYALDWDRDACATHRFNFPEATVECRDVREVSGAHIRAAAGGRVDLVAGGPNCQGVSQLGLRGPDDPRNFMLQEFTRLVSELRPRMFLLENVPGLAHRHNFLLLRSIFAWFRGLGYRCGADVLLAADYGVPQLRHRFLLVGTLDDALPLTLPLPTHHAAPEPTLFARPYVTVGDAIGDLPSIDAAHHSEEPIRPAPDASGSPFRAYVREGEPPIYNHVCAATSERNLTRARHVGEGGNWKDLPPELLPPRLFACRMTDHSTAYARLRRDQPSFTITSLFSNTTAGAFTHPTDHRALSVREGARLQSFPDRFVFVGPRSSQTRQIGNAVPPLFARAVGSHLRSLLLGEPVEGRAPRITEEVLADRRAWDALPVLTPRFRALFGTGTRWPKGWGPEPAVWAEKLDRYYLRPEFRPAATDEEQPAGYGEGATALCAVGAEDV